MKKSAYRFERRKHDSTVALDRRKHDDDLAERLVRGVRMWSPKPADRASSKQKEDPDDS